MTGFDKISAVAQNTLKYCFKSSGDKVRVYNSAKRGHVCEERQFICSLLFVYKSILCGVTVSWFSEDFVKSQEKFSPVTAAHVLFVSLQLIDIPVYVLYVAACKHVCA